MAKLTEIRWHARAGQGAVTASRLVAETAMDDGQYMQAMPEYGAERQGAPLKAYTRISPEPIQIHNNILNPDIVILLDDSLLGVVDICEGIKDDGMVIINSRMCPLEIRRIGNIPENIELHEVDASAIAVDCIGRDIPNAPIAGALARVSDCINIDSLKKFAETSFSQKFNEKIVAGNIKAIERAYEEVQ